MSFELKWKAGGILHDRSSWRSPDRDADPSLLSSEHNLEKKIKSEEKKVDELAEMHYLRRRN